MQAQLLACLLFVAVKEEAEQVVEEAEDEAGEVEDEASALGSIRELRFVCFSIFMYLLCFDSFMLPSLLVVFDWCNCSAFLPMVESFNLPLLQTLH